MFDHIDALFFDMDGTIIDSMWMWHDIDVEFLADHGLTYPEDLQAKIGGRNFYETAVFFKEEFHLSESLEELMNCWNAMALEKYRTEVPLKPGFYEFLVRAKALGYRLAIATSNSKDLAMACLDAHKITGYFDAIVTGTDGIAGKPKPDVYLECAKRCKVTPSRCLVFEDIADGLRAGIAAGMHTCAIYDAFSAEHTDEIRALAEDYLTDFCGLKDRLKETEQK